MKQSLARRWGDTGSVGSNFVNEKAVGIDTGIRGVCYQSQFFSSLTLSLIPLLIRPRFENKCGARVIL